MPDVKGFHKGISNITHLKTNRPKLHSAMQRTFYPRLQGEQAAWASAAWPVAAPCRSRAGQPGKPAKAGRAEPGLSIHLAQSIRRMVVGKVPHHGAGPWRYTQRLIQSLTLQGGDVDSSQTRNHRSQEVEWFAQWIQLAYLVLALEASVFSMTLCAVAINAGIPFSGKMKRAP